MNIELVLSKGSIVLKAKDDTYLSARTTLAIEVNDKQVRYEMQADERDTHERKLLSGIGVALSELKLELNRYDISDTLCEGSDSFKIIIQVSDRFRQDRVKDLERLIGEYIYRRIVADWWQVNFPNMANQYYANASTALDSIKKCFALSKPIDASPIEKWKCFWHPKGYRVIIIYKEELLNEINGEMLKLSRSRINEKGMPDMTLQTDEIEDAAIITRYINRRIQRVSERINAYLIKYTTSTDNNSFDRQDIYQFNILMPKGWDDRLFEQLAEEIHGYIVNASLFELLKTTLSEAAGIFGSQADSCYDNIKHVISVRKQGIIRKSLQPF